MIEHGFKFGYAPRPKSVDNASLVGSHAVSLGSDVTGDFNSWQNTAVRAPDLTKFVLGIKIDSHLTAQHDTTRYDKIFLLGFDMLEFTLGGHWQIKTDAYQDT